MAGCLLIVNPISGRGFARRALPEIEQRLKEHGVDYRLALTERPWHAAELAEQGARQGYEVVVAAGGDGTSNEVLNGLMHAHQAGYENTAMGILAIGTGNDFAYGMGIPSGVEAGCRVLTENYRRRMDIGLLKGGDYPQGRYFGNGVGVGFDAMTGFVAARIRRIRGLLLYLIAAIQTVFVYYHPPLIHLRYDDQELTQPSLMVSIMNGRRMGGGFLMAPDGDPADGLFDLCIATSASRLRIFQLIPYFIKGTQATQKEVRTARARTVRVTALEGSLPVHCDGETVCYAGQELEVTLLLAQIEFVTRRL